MSAPDDTAHDRDTAARLDESDSAGDAMRLAMQEFVGAIGVDHAQAIAYRIGPDQGGEVRSEFDPGMIQRLAESGVGPYQIEHELGTGGMGIVYLALQTTPIRRRVALKLIKPGMDSRAVISRFEAERQVLALMSHPNIAKVYDAGTTAWGHPYFAMEFVPGLPLDRHCDTTRMPVDARLRLFIDVCHAVQHAHQNGIIHRDLKPSNVLVAEQDGLVTPKIIDFGLAKATREELPSKQATRAGGPVGTLAYMSPEQAGFFDAAVDTRTDVYALGVILYRLLTGEHPFDTSDRRSTPYDESRRRMQQERAVRPSSRVGCQDESRATRVAQARMISHPHLLRRLRGDLDWIVLRAMETDPQRRYATVSEFATDVQRHLDHEPISAGPPGIGYQVRKFARRHRTAVASSLAVLAILILALGVSLRLYVNAEQARVHAKEHSDSAEDLHRYLKTILSSPSRNASEFDDQSLTDIVLRESRALDEELRDKPSIEASIRALFGTVLIAAAHPEEAVVQLRLALDRWDGLGEAYWLGSRPRPSERLERVDAIHALCRALIGLGHYAEAETRLRASLGAREIFDPLPSDERAKARASLRLDLATALRIAGRGGEAREHLLAILPEDPVDALNAHETSSFVELLKVEAGLNDPALIDHLEALRLFLDHSRTHARQNAKLRAELGGVLRTIRRFDEAELELLAAHQALEPIFQPNHRLLREIADEIALLYTEWGREGDDLRAASWQARGSS